MIAIQRPIYDQSLMIAIHKQVLKIKDEQLIELPIGAEILSVGNQYGNISIWYKCNIEADKIMRKIYIRGTGHKFSGGEHRFIGSVLMINGDLVWHVFEG